MAEDHLNITNIHSLNECLVFAKNQEFPIGLIVIGGVAMELYGLPRGTMDIDAEISCDSDFYEALVHHLKEKGIQFNIGDNIDHWGVVPLPSGYRERARRIFEDHGTEVKILDPLDFIFSKLRRGVAQDMEDALAVARHFALSSQDVSDHTNKVNFPLSDETFLFKKGSVNFSPFWRKTLINKEKILSKFRDCFWKFSP